MARKGYVGFSPPRGIFWSLAERLGLPLLDEDLCFSPPRGIFWSLDTSMLMM